MPETTPQVPAPELQGGTWINSPPLSLRGLQGKPVVVDFWDYTCINCIRTLPYLTEWHRRYSPHGLTIVGVHAPEFSFAQEADAVRKAVEDLGISYPVVLDNDFVIWRAYGNRYWPAKYLVDGEGFIRYYHFGEGNYGETEAMIQGLIKEVNPDVALPPLMPPVRDSDEPGAACYRVTPELYLGYTRGQIGNPQALAPDQVADLRDPGKHAEGYFYVEGRWYWGAEHAMYAGDQGSTGKLSLRYTAKEVNLIVKMLHEGAGEVEILQDGRPIEPQDAGQDVRFDETGRGRVAVESPRMYRLVNNSQFSSRELTMVVPSTGLAFYAFTFVSCPVEW